MAHGKAIFCSRPLSRAAPSSHDPGGQSERAERHQAAGNSACAYCIMMAIRVPLVFQPQSRRK